MKRGPRPDLAERNRANAVHGMTGTRTHKVWTSLRERCNNPAHKHYADYGGRGIKVCARWDDFRNFLADMGEAPEGMTLDRERNHEGYEPGNCRWVTQKVQCRNRRSNRMIEFNGETKPLAKWADDLGIERKTLTMRLNAWTVERAFSTPYQARKGTK